jgi:hypothetical protein
MDPVRRPRRLVAPGRKISYRRGGISVRFTDYSFGSARVDGMTYDQDLIIDRGKIRKRKKAASRGSEARTGAGGGDADDATTRVAIVDVTKPRRGRRRRYMTTALADIPDSVISRPDARDDPAHTVWLLGALRAGRQRPVVHRLDSPA